MIQYSKIIAKILRTPEKLWWEAKDFMQPDLVDLFVGYEAGPRLSELNRNHPSLFEVRWNGRFKQYRLKIEDPKSLINALPYDILQEVGDDLKSAGIVSTKAY